MKIKILDKHFEAEFLPESALIWLALLELNGKRAYYLAKKFNIDLDDIILGLQSHADNCFKVKKVKK